MTDLDQLVTWLFKLRQLYPTLNIGIYRTILFTEHGSIYFHGTF